MRLKKLKFTMIGRIKEQYESQHKELASTCWRVKYMVDTIGGVQEVSARMKESERIISR
jgi:hypothetical protein